MNNITIRPAVPADTDSIYDIEHFSFTVPWSRESFVSAFSSDMIAIYAAEQDGRVIGFGCISVLSPESEVLNIAVHPDMRGCGVGRLLLHAMLTHAREKGADTAYLEVRESNTPARTLYESAGFTPMGIRKNYYDKPKENAVVMMKGLG